MQLQDCWTPASLLLQRYLTTVSVVHEYMTNPGSWLKPGAIVIDAGTNSVQEPACLVWFGYVNSELKLLR
ncbi:hypothetical protein V2J09_023084 [Rumex salicifolius]